MRTVRVPLLLTIGLTLAGCPNPIPNISFDVDDGGPIEAPCKFSDTLPLRDGYASMGVTFDGGGGILDLCASFEVTGGLTTPNILGHNAAETYSDGSSAAPPTTIAFGPPLDPAEITCVTILAGAGNQETGTITLDAFDLGDVLVDSDSIPVGPALQFLGVRNDEGISRVVIDSTNGVFAAENLYFGNLCFGQ